MKAGSVTAVNSTVPMPWFGFEETVKAIIDWRTRAESLRDHGMAVVASEKEIRERHATGLVGTIIGAQSANGIEDDLSNLEALHLLGMRIMGLAYQRRNFLADGCSESANGGLSRFGFAAVKAMNEVGILVDVSHTGDASAMDTVAASGKPVVYSHGGVRALCDHPRNISDALMDAIADGGGVIGIAAPSFMLKKAEPGYLHETTVDDVLDHIEYVIERVGVEHVGLGLDVADRRRESDYEEYTYARYPEIFGRLQPGMFERKFAYGAEDQSKVPNVIDGLRGRGYSDEDVAAIAGENFLRVFAAAWGG